MVLIPLLVDDPLWVIKEKSNDQIIKCLNPSFSG